jgi:hypothetical protein
VPILLENLIDDSGNLSHGAVCKLGVIGDSVAVDELLQHLTDENDNPRESVVTALGRIGDVAATPFLIQYLGNEDTDMVFCIIDALFEIGSPPSDALIARLQDERVSVREKILEKSMGQTVSGGQYHEPLLPVIAHGLEDPDGRLANIVTAWFIEDEEIERYTDIMNGKASMMSISAQLQMPLSMNWL